MKLLLLLLLCINTTEPIQGLNGVFFRKGNYYMVNVGWWSTYFDNVTCTYKVKYNGIVIAENYDTNIISIPVTKDFRSGTFTVSQTVNGISSIEKSTIVRK